MGLAAELQAEHALPSQTAGSQPPSEGGGTPAWLIAAAAAAAAAGAGLVGLAGLLTWRRRRRRRRQVKAEAAVAAAATASVGGGQGPSLQQQDPPITRAQPRRATWNRATWQGWMMSTSCSLLPLSATLGQTPSHPTGPLMQPAGRASCRPAVAASPLHQPALETPARARAVARAQTSHAAHRQAGFRGVDMDRMPCGASG